MKKGYDTIHTLELSNRNATKDTEIQLSIQEEQIVITRDADFYDSYTNKLETIICLKNSISLRDTSKLLGYVNINTNQLY